MAWRPLFPMSPEKPWQFFLSYAHADLDGLLKGFVGDLSKAVEDRLRISPPAGFMDESGILVGMDWSDRLGQALRQSLVLVCLVSKGYLQSESCGRELEVFLRRRELLPPGTNAEVILPVFWESPAVADQIPPRLSIFQNRDANLPEAYLTSGTKAIAIKRDMGPSRETDPYYQLLLALSVKIALAADNRLPEISAEQAVAFGNLPNALLPLAPIAPTNAGSNGTRVFEINLIYVIPAATDFAQAPAGGYSDDGGWYWKPFPTVDETIGQLVYQAPSKYRRHEHTAIQAELVDKLIAMGKQDQLVILLVDPRATLIPRYLEFLQRFDQCVVSNNAIIAIGADADSEDRLSRGFENTFPKLKGTPYFKYNVANKESLLQELSVTLERLIDDIVKRRRLGTRFRGEQLPILKLPGRVA